MTIVNQDGASSAKWRASAVIAARKASLGVRRRKSATAPLGEMRRIVVTGMGAISPLGANVKASWSRLLSGRSGLRRLPDDMVAPHSTA